MTRHWIEELSKRVAMMGESNKQDTSAHVDVNRAFARLQRELRETVAELEQRLSRGFTVSQLGDSSWLVEARTAGGPFTGTRFTFDEAGRTVRTDPSANFAQTKPADHHTFAFDPGNNSFSENGDPVTDEQLIERGLQPFLRGMFGSF